MVLTIPLEAEKLVALKAAIPLVDPSAAALTPAIVICPAALLVVVIPVPAARVTVPPWAMVELDPVVAARVKRVPPPITHVEQVMLPKESTATGVVADTATVPVALGKVQVLSAVVRSAEVIIPLIVAPVPVLCGLISIVSEFVVLDANLVTVVVALVKVIPPDPADNPNDEAPLVLPIVMISLPVPVAESPM